MSRRTKEAIEKHNRNLKSKLETTQRRYAELATACYWRLGFVISELSDCDPELQTSKLKLPIQDRGNLLLVESKFYQIIKAAEVFKQLCESEAGSIIR